MKSREATGLGRKACWSGFTVGDSHIRHPSRVLRRFQSTLPYWDLRCIRKTHVWKSIWCVFSAGLCWWWDAWFQWEHGGCKHRNEWQRQSDHKNVLTPRNKADGQLTDVLLDIQKRTGEQKSALPANGASNLSPTSQTQTLARKGGNAVLVRKDSARQPQV